MISTVMLISCLMLPAVMLIAGCMMYKHTPHHGSVPFGYRSKASMRSPETWKFANEYCGKLWLRLGLALLLAVIAAFILMWNDGDDAVAKTGVIIIVAETALMVVSIGPVEAALKKRFDKDGKPIDTDKNNG